MSSAHATPASLAASTLAVDGKPCAAAPYHPQAHFVRILQSGDKRDFGSVCVLDNREIGSTSANDAEVGRRLRPDVVGEHLARLAAVSADLGASLPAPA